MCCTNGTQTYFAETCKILILLIFLACSRSHAPGAGCGKGKADGSSRATKPVESQPFAPREIARSTPDSRPRRSPRLPTRKAESLALYAQNRPGHTGATPQFQSNASMTTNWAVPPPRQTWRGDADAPIMKMRVQARRGLRLAAHRCVRHIQHRWRRGRAAEGTRLLNEHT